MAVEILNVSVTPSVTTVGQPITVRVSAREVDWSNIKSEFSCWGEVKCSFTNWSKVLNYIYNKPTADANAVCCSSGYALFDADGKQISITGGYTSAYTAEQVNEFLKGVLDG